MALTTQKNLIALSEVDDLFQLPGFPMELIVALHTNKFMPSLGLLWEKEEQLNLTDMLAAQQRNALQPQQSLPNLAGLQLNAYYQVHLDIFLHKAEVHY